MKKGNVGVLLLVVILLASLLAGCQGGRVKELEAQNQQLQAQLTGLKTQVADLETQVSGLEAQVTDKDAELGAKDAKIGELEDQITGLTAELAKLPKDPSYGELWAFLKEDKTDRETHRSHAPYTWAFLKNAKAKGILGYPTGVVLDSNIVLLFACFKTTDKGWIYILPAQDKVVKLEIGEAYHKLNDSTFGSRGDIMLEIMVFD